MACTCSTPIETIHCRRVRVFKWYYDLPSNLLPPGFGLFTTLLETSFDSFSDHENSQAQLKRITTRPILCTFTFDLKLLSSPQSFLQLLADKFQNMLPPHVATEVEEHVAENFVYGDETPLQISKTVIVADIFHHITFRCGKVKHAVTNTIGEADANILFNLRCYLKIPKESFDSDRDSLIEVPPLKGFQGVKFNSNLQAGKEEDKCAICLGELSDKKKIMKKTKCSHLFHRDCLARWLLRKPSCPMCRLSLKRKRLN